MVQSRRFDPHFTKMHQPQRVTRSSKRKATYALEETVVQKRPREPKDESAPKSRKKKRIPRQTGPYIIEEQDLTSKAQISITVFECQPTQQALIVAGKGTYALVDDHPISALAENEVRIRNHAVGLNPIDWKSVDYNFCLPQFPWITGREMAGVVDEVGSAVDEWKVGDKVWTSKFLSVYNFAIE